MGNIRNCIHKMLLAVVGLSAAFGCVALHADETDKDQDQKVRPFLNCDASLKFENEHISLGRFGGRQMLIPKVKIYHELNDSVITYIGTDVFASIKHGNESYNDVEPRVGFEYKINDIFSVDVGYRHYFFTGLSVESANGEKRDASEMYASLLADVSVFDKNFSTSLYCSYNWDFEDFDLEGNIVHSVDLSKFIATRTRADLGVKFGYRRMSKPGGKKFDKSIHGSKDYFYYGTGVDIVHECNDFVSIKGGVSFGGNAGGKHGWINNASGGRKRFVWGNVAIVCKF